MARDCYVLFIVILLPPWIHLEFWFLYDFAKNRGVSTCFEMCGISTLCSFSAFLGVWHCGTLWAILQMYVEWNPLTQRSAVSFTWWTLPIARVVDIYVVCFNPYYHLGNIEQGSVVCQLLASNSRQKTEGQRIFQTLFYYHRGGI